jgi:hypothetical protein
MQVSSLFTTTAVVPYYVPYWRVCSTSYLPRFEPVRLRWCSGKAMAAGNNLIVIGPITIDNAGQTFETTYYCNRSAMLKFEFCSTNLSGTAPYHASIVQSNNIRRIYDRCYLRTAGNDWLTQQPIALVGLDDRKDICRSRSRTRLGLIGHLVLEGFIRPEPSIAISIALS